MSKLADNKGSNCETLTMRYVVLFITAVLVGKVFGFSTLNDTRPLYDGDKSATFGIVSEGSQGGLSGRVMKIGQRTLTPIVPLNGQPIPSINQYANGTLVVGSMTTKGHPGVDQKNYYEVQIKGPKGQIDGSFLVPEAALHGLSSFNAAQTSKQTLDLMKHSPMFCPQCGGLTFDSNKPSPEKQKEYKDQLYKQRAERRPSVLPASRYNPGVRQPERNSERRDDIGNAPFAGGETTSAGDSQGLINLKSDDPNADNITPGCEELAEKSEGEDQKLTKESLSKCINNIQDYILQDITPPAKSTDRDKVFSRLFMLPNQEQEFAAAIFTLTGEIGSIAKERPMEGIMILKVMSNRRNNANQVEEAIDECDKQHGSDQQALNSCYSKANKDSVFNLLDIALDKSQFSMYNRGGGHNWTNNMGSKNNGQFDTAIETFLNYSSMEEYNITGGGGNADIDRIYHYHTPAVYPDWRDDSKKLKISGSSSEYGDLEATKSHVFYYNHDSGGRTSGDGWFRNVRHEYRTFPNK